MIHSALLNHKTINCARLLGKRNGESACNSKNTCYYAFHKSGAGWSSLVARRAHNPKVVGSNPAPATNLIILICTIKIVSFLLRLLFEKLSLVVVLSL